MFEQIFSLIPKECDGERFEESLARVRQCVGGGAATENADSDSDLEVVADSILVKLCCPVSGSCWVLYFIIFHFCISNLIVVAVARLRILYSLYLSFTF